MTFIVRMLAVTALAGLIPGSAVAQGLAQTSESMATTSSLTLHHERASQLLGTTTGTSTADAPGKVTYRVLSQEELAEKIAAAGFDPPRGSAPFIIYRPGDEGTRAYDLGPQAASDASGAPRVPGEGRVQAIDIGGPESAADRFTNRLSLALSNVDPEEREAAYRRVMGIAAWGWPLTANSGVRAANLYTIKKGDEGVELVLEAIYLTPEIAAFQGDQLKRMKTKSEELVEVSPASWKKPEMMPGLRIAAKAVSEGIVTVDGNRVVHQWLLPPEAMGAFLVAAGVK